MPRKYGVVLASAAIALMLLKINAGAQEKN